MTLTGFVFRNLLRNSRRTLLTVASIGVSLAMIVILRSVLAELLHPTGMNETIPRLVVRHRTALTLSLPDSYGPKIAAIPGVKAVTPMNWFGGQYKSEDQDMFFARFAVDPDSFFQVYTDFKPTKPEYLDALKTERTAALIGQKLMESKGFEIGQKITITGDIYPVDLELTIRGTYNGPDETWLMFQRKYLDELLGTSARSGTYFLLADSPEVVPGLTRALEEEFRNSESEVKVETEKAFQLSFIQMLGNVTLLFSALIGVMAFAVVLIAASTMAMAMRERTREIAVLKTLGFSGQHLMIMVLAEGMLIAILGGLLGVGGTWLLLPSPRLFVSAAVATIVAAVVGLLLLAASLLLSDVPPAPGEQDRSYYLQRFITAFGPWLALAAGVMAGAARFISMSSTDWMAFSAGFVPFMYVRADTALFACTMAFIIGVASSILPAWNAARVPALVAMRDIG